MKCHLESADPDACEGFRCTTESLLQEMLNITGHCCVDLLLFSNYVENKRLARPLIFCSLSLFCLLTGIILHINV